MDYVVDVNLNSMDLIQRHHKLMLARNWCKNRFGKRNSDKWVYSYTKNRFRFQDKNDALEFKLIFG